MTTLEEALSRTFADQAEGPAPALDDLANRVIARGRAQRRANVAASGGLAMFVATMATVVVVADPMGTPSEDVPSTAAPQVGVALPQPDPGVPAKASPSLVPQAAARLPVDLVTSGRLELRDGRAVKLGVTAAVDEVYRAPDGFVIVELQAQRMGWFHDVVAHRRGWFVDEKSGAQALLFDNASAVAVATDGSGRLAWVSDGSMYYRLAVSTSSGVRRTGAPTEGAPVGFVGDAVLLAAPAADTSPPRHDLWFPARGDYRPTWADFGAVYGTRLSGEQVVVARETADKQICIVLLRAIDLTDIQSGCGLVETLPRRGWVSPNGRWLVVIDERRAHVFDLSAKWRQGAVLHWAVEDVQGEAAWVDPDTIALHTADRLLVLPLRLSGKAAEYKLPSDAVIVGQ